MIESEVISSFTCDKCGLVANGDTDHFEYQEFLSVSRFGGYGSVFGDGLQYEVDLCQSCVKDLLGDYVRVVGSLTLTSTSSSASKFATAVYAEVMYHNEK